MTEVPHADPLDPHIARMAVWGGLAVDRDRIRREEISDRLPILTYHSICDSELGDLDEYRVSTACVRGATPAPPRERVSRDDRRRVGGASPHSTGTAGARGVLTFDDAYQDFLDVAWPMLVDYGFPATVFVVTDRIGKTSDWDADLGEPRPLLDWRSIRRLHDAGVDIGSHTSHHRALTTMSPREVLAERVENRRVLEAALGRPVQAIAYPFGAVAEVTRQAAWAAGHRVGFESGGGWATAWDDPMSVPRLDAASARSTLDDFAADARRARVAESARPRRGRTRGRQPSPLAPLSGGVSFAELVGFRPPGTNHGSTGATRI